MASSMEKDKETVAIEEEGFSLELPAPSGWKKKVRVMGFGLEKLVFLSANAAVFCTAEIYMLKQERCCEIFYFSWKNKMKRPSKAIWKTRAPSKLLFSVGSKGREVYKEWFMALRFYQVVVGSIDKQLNA
ncbi:hypothetical protein OIU78_003411 [Salix suchowensis]|nr:hypothetical protein OIU78_003411 [Salix suchowensis]